MYRKKNGNKKSFSQWKVVRNNGKEEKSKKENSKEKSSKEENQKESNKEEKSQKEKIRYTTDLLRNTKGSVMKIEPFVF